MKHTRTASLNASPNASLNASLIAPGAVKPTP